MTSSNESAVDIAHVYRGTFVHSTDHTAVEILEDRLLGVDTEGKVCHRRKLYFNIFYEQHYVN